VKRWLLAAVLAALAASAIAETPLPWSDDEVKAIARHGPWPPPAPRDPSNRVAGLSNAIVLGEHLFNEPRLSADGAMSCATCHVAGRDWGDGRAKAVGRSELDRRTPSL
jgi:cytochrome c peroxidase